MELTKYSWYSVSKTTLQILSMFLYLWNNTPQSRVLLWVAPHLFHYFRVRLFSPASTLRKNAPPRSSCSTGRPAARGRCFPPVAAPPQCCWWTRSAFDCCRTQWRTEQGSRCSTEDNNTSTGWIPGETSSAAAYLRVLPLKLALLCTTDGDGDAAAAIFCCFLAHLSSNTERRS